MPVNDAEADPVLLSLGQLLQLSQRLLAQTGAGDIDALAQTREQHLTAFQSLNTLLAKGNRFEPTHRALLLELDRLTRNILQLAGEQRGLIGTDLKKIATGRAASKAYQNQRG